jgi:hypothetical protein
MRAVLSAPWFTPAAGTRATPDPVDYMSRASGKQRICITCQYRSDWSRFQLAMWDFKAKAVIKEWFAAREDGASLPPRTFEFTRRAIELSHRRPPSPDGFVRFTSRATALAPGTSPCDGPANQLDGGDKDHALSRKCWIAPGHRAFQFETGSVSS